jgi:lysophospholipase L1-like esterase
LHHLLVEELQDQPLAAIPQIISIIYHDVHMTDSQRTGCDVEAVRDCTLSRRWGGKRVSEWKSNVSVRRASCVGCLTVLLVVVPSSPLIGAESAPKFSPAPVELICSRDGLGNVIAKLQAGKPVKIAYLGGSITAAAGWRVQTRQWFSDEFPESQVEGINAAIGGTGSDLGVFRLHWDALRHGPDLLFVEFAVNDGGAPPDRIWRAMEGIVRQTWAANPRTDICFVYTYRVGYEKDLRRSLCPPAASAMEMLAEHYRIPSINLALKVVQLQQAGKLVFRSSEPTATGVVRFSEDGVHPLAEGHRIYTNLVAQAVQQMTQNSRQINYGSKLKAAFVEDHWQAAKMVPVTSSELFGEWKELAPETTLAKRFGNRMGRLWESTHPGSRLTFRFRGSMASLYDLLGPDGGQVIITVDGKTREKPVPRFDSYCTYHRIATLPIAEGLDPEQVHTASVEIHSQQPDRSPVAFRLKDPDTELCSPKYQGTKIRVSKILVLGDVEE